MADDSVTHFISYQEKCDSWKYRDAIRNAKTNGQTADITTYRGQSLLQKWHRFSDGFAVIGDHVAKVADDLG
jgi:hypothetical protein